jgi:monoamine oxidase
MPRNSVYPSYPPVGTKSSVLIVSYCWTQDAQRLGALIDKNTPTVSSTLLDLVLRDLAEVHGMRVSDFPNIIDTYAFDWTTNPATQGKDVL